MTSVLDQRTILEITPARIGEEATCAQVITATPRQLESSVRLAEALAKMRLSPTVEREDVMEGLRLMKVGSKACEP